MTSRNFYDKSSVKFAKSRVNPVCEGAINGPASFRTSTAKITYWLTSQPRIVSYYWVWQTHSAFHLKHLI